MREQDLLGARFSRVDRLDARNVTRLERVEVLRSLFHDFCKAGVAKALRVTELVGKDFARVGVVDVAAAGGVVRIRPVEAGAPQRTRLAAIGRSCPAPARAEPGPWPTWARSYGTREVDSSALGDI